MPTPTAFKITVTEVFDPINITAAAEKGLVSDKVQETGRDVFFVLVPASDFDRNSFMSAVLKTKRVRKARSGKETT